MRTKTTPTELGTEKIGKLLKQYAIPAIIAMTASSLYNITDSIFIGHGVGPLALSALAICFPLMNLAAAFGSLVGAGGATLLSIRLGQKDYETGNIILGNVLVLNLVIGVAFSVAILLFLDPILYFFGASPDTLPHARDYMRILLYGNVFTHMYMGLNTLLRSAGNPEKSMYATIATVIINAGLNAIFIFGFGWGISGAAYATIIAQMIVLAWQFKFFSNKNYFIHLKKGIYKLRKKIVLDILSIGSAPFFMNAAACLVVIIINQALIRTGGDLAVGAYGIVNRIAFLFIMIVMGLNQGMQPIAGYNFGAKQYTRVTEILKKTILWATVILVFGFIIVELFPRTVASIFTTHEELVNLAANGLRLIFLAYPLVGFQMVTSNFFQSIGMAGKAIFMSLSRQLIFLLPCLLILPNFYGTNGVWISFPIADSIAFLVALIMLTHQFRSFKKKEKEAMQND
ncbi:MATE family efflux transporter [Paludibacter sp. 221]|uniref:MATE family efflux transporter n=1 Tax=Paludibacter sp. 221 TaxID=2302939 RepID=UPI0013CFF362|nr:MATE family efflux transporter [Paludibacter sp. 221]NDV47594.1 MATE family efflux transporter [Paludibacter sp. 221]